MSGQGGRAPKRLIIGLAGRIGAGKTSVGKHLESAHGFHYLRYSQVLADWRAEGSSAKANLQQIGWDVMGGGLQPELNRRLIAKIEGNGDYVVDGLRHPIDQQSLSQAFGRNFRLVFIKSKAASRFKRLQDRFGSREGFDMADTRPVEQHIPELEALADATVENEASLDRLLKHIDSNIKKFRSE